MAFGRGTAAEPFGSRPGPSFAATGIKPDEGLGLAASWPCPGQRTETPSVQTSWSHTQAWPAVPRVAGVRGSDASEGEGDGEDSYDEVASKCAQGHGCSNSPPPRSGRSLHGPAVRRLGAGEAAARTRSTECRPTRSLSTELPGPYDTLPTLLNSPLRRYRSETVSDRNVAPFRRCGKMVLNCTSALQDGDRCIDIISGLTFTSPSVQCAPQVA